MSQETEGLDSLELPVGISVVNTLPHSALAIALAWSPDGRRLASADEDHAVRIWDVQAGQLAFTLRLHGASVEDVGWSPDGTRLVSGDKDGTLRIWHLAADRPVITANTGVPVLRVAWSPDSRRVASGGPNYVKVWDSSSPKIVWEAGGHGTATGIAWSQDGRFLAVAFDSGVVRLHGSERGEEVAVLRHPDAVYALAWAPDSSTLATGGKDKTIQLWNRATRSTRAVLEGHAGVVVALVYSSDNRVLASAGSDSSVAIWDGETGARLASWNRPSKALAFHPREQWLAIHGSDRGAIDVYQVDIDLLLERRPATRAIRYTTAKIALVGDQLVGKTTLGHRMITREFKLFPRTHGQQFWIFPALSKKRSDGTECEAILWDLAGQPDYRLTHSLFLDDAHFALVAFNASDRQQPLKGAEYWLKVLKNRPGAPCPSLLVATQTDTGDVSLTTTEIADFCRSQGATGYVATSASTGEGIDELLARLKEQIDWDAIPATVTTSTFKRIKELALEIKARRVEGKGVVVTPSALMAELQAADPSYTFTESELMTAVGHLANHGFVTLLRTAAGDARILLKPDLLINLTASIVMEARRNPKGLGALKEAEVLSGSLVFRELSGLDTEAQRILVAAAVALFVKHNVCFRETLGTETLLVFPALIHQRKPQMANRPTFDDVSYTVTGTVEHLYSALAVLLGYTNTFVRTNQWHDQAEYEMDAGQICGFRRLSDREGEITLVLYYGESVVSRTRSLFEGLFETFLLARDLHVTKYPAVTCESAKCKYRQERDEVVKRIVGRKGFMRCAECGDEIRLPFAGEMLSVTQGDRETLQQEQATARLRTTYETALSHVKALVRTRGHKSPSCFVSYAWGSSRHERWVEELAGDLRMADVQVIVDKKDNAAIGSNVARFISAGISKVEFIAVVGTPLYLDKYENGVSRAGSIVAAEMDLIQQRLTGTEANKNTVLPVLSEGSPEESLPPLLRGRVYADFRRPDDYLIALFDLVLTLHGVHVADLGVVDLRAELRQHRQDGMAPGM